MPSDHVDYTCSYSGAAMSGGDRMNPSTRVLVVWYAWMSVAMSYRAKHSMPLPLEDPALAAPPGTKKAPGMSAEVPGMF
jgi:hypothetical protein